MTTRVDIEEIEATKSEKFLAVVLLAFLLIGTIWFYVKIDTWVPGGNNWEHSAAEQKAFDQQDDAWKSAESANAEVERRKSEVDLAKNRFDIAAAKGGAGARDAEDEYVRAESELAASTKIAQRQQRTAQEAEDAVAAINKAHQLRAQDSTHEWIVAGARLGFIATWFGASLRTLSALRRRQSRFLPLGFATVAAGVITALVFATDYVTDYIDPFDLGPIVLSAAGAGATIASFVALQRWLARRIPDRRVRNGECPFCGHPVRGGARHCEGCGREVVADCASCGQPRRVGSPHCGACGKA